MFGFYKLSDCKPYLSPYKIIWFENVNNTKKLREMIVNNPVGKFQNDRVVLVHGEEMLWLQVVGDS